MRYSNSNFERGTKLLYYDLLKMGMSFKKEELKQEDDERVKFAYFEFDLDYIGIPKKRFD